MIFFFPLAPPLEAIHCFFVTIMFLTDGYGIIDRFHNMSIVRNSGVRFSLGRSITEALEQQKRYAVPRSRLEGK